MPLETRFPELTAMATLNVQKAVEQAGQEVEYLALERASLRRVSGSEMGQIKWKPDRKKPPHSGVVVSGFVTRFHEYGTIFMAANPILGPAAETAEPHFLEEMQRAYR